MVCYMTMNNYYQVLCTRCVEGLLLLLLFLTFSALLVANSKKTTDATDVEGNFSMQVILF